MDKYILQARDRANAMGHRCAILNCFFFLRMRWREEGPVAVHRFIYPFRTPVADELAA